MTTHYLHCQHWPPHFLRNDVSSCVLRRIAHHGVHFAFHFTIAKLYTNSLYGSLNTRLAFRGKGERDVTVSAANLRVAGQSGVDSLSGTKYLVPRLVIFYSQRGFPRLFDSILNRVGSGRSVSTLFRTCTSAKVRSTFSTVAWALEPYTRKSRRTDKLGQLK